MAWGCARYTPQPLDPAPHAAAYRARRLDDPALAAWVERYGGPLRPGRWTERQLGLAALAHRADLERARREWLAASAGVPAAGSRPAPGAEAEVERRVSGRREGSPWVVSVAALFTVELGGKRAARLQTARAREAAAGADLALLVAGALARVRASILAVRHAEEVRDEASASLEALRRVEALERDRYAEAALGSGEVARTAAEAAAARAEVAAAERDVVVARADLAAAVAVPPAAIRELGIEAAPARGCEWGSELGEDSVTALALVRRAEMARALAAYAGAEAEVRARVAATYPDLELGPGFIWDQGVHRWTLGAVLPALLGLRSRAPIAQAEALRHAEAARVGEAQDELLAETGRALEACRGAALERTVADSQRVVAGRLAELARAAYERGETGRLDLARAELLQARAAALEGAARRRLERAGLRLELAAAEWRGAGASPWPDLREAPFTPDEEPR